MKLGFNQREASLNLRLLWDNSPDRKCELETQRVIIVAPVFVSSAVRVQKVKLLDCTF